MRLQYLGTAAAEGVPDPFCTCEVCRRARLLGGRNVRSRSQAVVDDTLLIDFPCDTFFHCVRHQVDLLNIRHCLITHVHEDHLYPQEILNFRKGFSQVPASFAPFCFYGSEDLADKIGGTVASTDGRVELHRLTPFETVPIAGFAITPLKAAHGTPHPYIYMIEKAGQTLLYAHDTDIFPEETWQFLKTRAPRFDFVSLDCTEAAKRNIYRGAHMCLQLNTECRRLLADAGMTHSGTVFCLNHFSHNGKDALYDDFEKIAAKEGFLTAYDGMIAEF